MFKKVSWLFIVVLVTAGCAGNPEYLRPDADLQQVAAIALLPIRDDPVCQGLGSRLTMNIHDWLEEADIQVFQPDNELIPLETINLAAVGPTDVGTAAEIGLSLGVPTVLTGFIHNVSSSIKHQSGEFSRSGSMSYTVSNASVTLNLVDTCSGEIVWSSSKRSSATGQDAELSAANKAADKLVKRLLRHTGG
ncbi:MAG: hypothetical protein JSW54_04670 [Fidelibacterota bacterium]|nr:MAG: hypothetical protein JSW54_04670 [Candidatus Neomarinimicrobiota bacterium]